MIDPRMRLAADDRNVAAANVYRIGSDRLLALVVIGSIVSYTLEGPIRFGLNAVSAEMLLYLRDVMAVVVVAFGLMSWAVGQGSAAPLVMVTCVLLAHLAIGMLNLPGTFQALMGMKVFLWFLVGFALAPLARTRPDVVLKLGWFVFVVTGIGVVLNYFIEFPWIGLSYETSFGTTHASKQWWMIGGALRLPGFARVSFNAAAFALVSLVPLLAASDRVPRKLLLLGMAGTVFALTTTKGAWTGVAALLIDAALVSMFRGALLANAFIVVLALTCIALPLIAVEVGVVSSAVPDWTLSFMQRVADMWPRAFALIRTPGDLLWGRGLGGIGVPQTFGEWQSSNAADNLMIYLLVTFGVFGMLYVAAFLSRLTRYLSETPITDFTAKCVRGWTALWFGYGLTTNMVEDPMTNMTIGLVFGIVLGVAETQRTATSDSPPQPTAALSPWRPQRG